MAVDVKIPAVGESVQEAMIHKWHKAAGDWVQRDDVLLEVETDKATVEVTAEAEGQIEILRAEGDTVPVGAVIAKINTEAARPAAGTEKNGPNGGRVAAKPQSIAAPPAAPKVSAAAPGPSAPILPSVRRMVTEHQLDPSSLSPSGKGGRLTKGDVIDHIEGGGLSQARAPAKDAPTPVLPRPKEGSGRTERREPMSMLRRRVAERLKQAQNTAAMLTTFNEVDMKAVMDLRKQYKDAFKEKHGVGLGFMSFFVKASIEALKAFPQVNGWIDGNEIVFHDFYDIGVAVSTERGLVVPVVRDADRLSAAEIEMAIAHFGAKARDGKISVDDLTGGTFTVSNGGVFGSLLSTPILNPPQSAILGMHKIEERPVVINGQILARPMMYLALSYDHRIVDGREAVQFLVKIKELIEDPARLLLGV